MNHPIMLDPTALSRADAAQMLATLRLLHQRQHWDDRSDELLDWAALLLPTSKPIQRLKIRRMLAQQRAADALAALSILLQRFGTDRILLLLRAKALWMQGEPVRAVSSVAMALNNAPQCCKATVCFADDVFHAAGEHDRSITLLQKAIERFTNDDDLCERCARSMIAAGRADEAISMLWTMSKPPAQLLAEALAQSGRSLESMEVLGSCANSMEGSTATDAAIARQITIVQLLGDEQAMESLIASIPASCHESRLAAANALLRIGRFTEALRLAIATYRNQTAPPTTRRRAAHTAAVCAGSCDRESLARRVITRLRRGSGGVDPTEMAAAWRRAMLGQILRSQRDCQLAGSDAHTSVLTPLLTSARGTFRRVLNSSSGQHPSNRAGCEQHLAQCEAALGHLDAAITAFCRGLDQAEHDQIGPIGRIGASELSETAAADAA